MYIHYLHCRYLPACVYMTTVTTGSPLPCPLVSASTARLVTSNIFDNSITSYLKSSKALPPRQKAQQQNDNLMY